MAKRKMEIEVYDGPSKRSKTSTQTLKIVRNPKSGPTFKKGYDRKSGYYGRFSGPQGELKFFDTALSFNIDATAEIPATGQLCLVPQGVTESTRVGRKCTIKSIQINASMNMSPGAAATCDPLVTLVLVQDTQTNGAACTPGDVYDLGATGLQGSLRNIENGERFKILKRWDIRMTPNAGVSAAYNQVIKKWDFYKKCQIPLEFSSTTGAITELKTNNVFLLAGALGGDDLTNIVGLARIRFSDN